MGTGMITRDNSQTQGAGRTVWPHTPPHAEHMRTLYLPLSLASRRFRSTGHTYTHTHKPLSSSCHKSQGRIAAEWDDDKRRGMKTHPKIIKYKSQTKKAEPADRSQERTMQDHRDRLSPPFPPCNDTRPSIIIPKLPLLLTGFLGGATPYHTPHPYRTRDLRGRQI